MAATHGSGLFLSLPKDVNLARVEGKLVFQRGARIIEFKELSRGTFVALEMLAQGAEEEDKLADFIVEADGPAALSKFYYSLHRLSQARLLLRSVRIDGQPLATLEPLSPYFTFESTPLDPQRQYMISRFAFIRAEGGDLLLESPLAHARLSLHGPQPLALFQALVQPHSVDQLSAKFDWSPAAVIKGLLDLYANVQLLTAVSDEGQPFEATNSRLRLWEFHDLLFHSRSRTGRHNNPSGSAYRLVGELDPPPALKPAPAGDAIQLYGPDPEQLRRSGSSFAAVQESRSSVRDYDRHPITDRDMGEFLFRTARVIERRVIERPTPRGPVMMEFARRPYPGSGGLHELELYVGVNNCINLRSGLYYYDPENHSLINIEARQEHLDELLSETGNSAGIRKEDLQVAIFVAARFQRLAWKYASAAYALILKNVGVLYETMYLVATAMGLAPCAVGCGNSDLFARAIRSDYYEETTVGEFLLGSKRH